MPKNECTANFLRYNERTKNKTLIAKKHYGAVFS